MSVGLELWLDRTSFGPGETVTGTVQVREGGSSRSLQVLLSYVERTTDYHEIAWQIGTGLLHQGPLEPGASFPFSLVLPADALPPYSAPFSELYWEVDAKSDELGLDSDARVRIDVRPAAPPPPSAQPSTDRDGGVWGSGVQYGGAWEGDKGVWGSG